MVKVGLVLGVSAISLSLCLPVQAQGLAGSPQAAPQQQPANMCSYTNPFGLLPKFTPEFWKQMSTSRVGPGTVLTGILDDTLGSTVSKAGDIFSLRLQDGFSVDGKEVIPKQSRIIGTVIGCKSARLSKTGMPGSLDVSLQTLVFPDGRTTPFYGFIEHNPSTDMRHKPGSEPIDFIGYGRKGIGGLLTTVTGRAGMPIRLPNFGQEMRIEKGEAVPIRLSRTLDLSRMNAAPSTVQSPQMPPSPSSSSFQPDPVSLLQPASVPGLQNPGRMYPPGLAQPAAPQVGLAAPPAMSLDSLSSPGPSIGADLGSSGDPNSIFSSPIRQGQPQADIADPF